MPSKELSSVSTPERSMREKCGIVGIYNPGSTILQQFETGTIGARALWHRGQQGLGFTINTDRGTEKHLRKGRTIEAALPDSLRHDFEEMEGTSDWALFHTRYGTSGDYNPDNLQPIRVRTPDGIHFSVTHNGEFVATELMAKEISENIPEGASDTFIFAKMLQYSQGNTPDEKIMNTLNKANGAYSLLIGTDGALFAARDQFGIRPMVIGKYQNGWIIASETHALDKLGIYTEREIRRGEIIKIDKNGLTTLKKGYDNAGNFCDLEWTYFSRPDSVNPMHDRQNDSTHPERWLSNYMFRERCGLILAQKNPIKNATFVFGVPDSGVPVGSGYAMGMKIPHRPVTLRDHYDENGQHRTFMQDEWIKKIPDMVFGKLSSIPDKRIWKDAIVVVADDSIVRGSTSRAITEGMFNAGAKEVHWLSGFPQIKYPCHLGVSMRTDAELIANRCNGDEEAIAKEIGATSVHYITPEDLINARIESGSIRLPKDPKEIFLENGGCGGCITGIYPISKEGVIFQRKN